MSWICILVDVLLRCLLALTALKSPSHDPNMLGRGSPLRHCWMLTSPVQAHTSVHIWPWLEHPLGTHKNFCSPGLNRGLTQSTAMESKIKYFLIHKCIHKNTNGSAPYPKYTPKSTHLTTDQWSGKMCKNPCVSTRLTPVKTLHTT